MTFCDKEELTPSTQGLSSFANAIVNTKESGFSKILAEPPIIKKSWTTPVSLDAYHKCKKSANPIECIENIFLAKEYRSDYEQNIKPKPAYVTDAYKKKAASFYGCTKFSKNLDKFSDKKTLVLSLESVLMLISTMNDESADVTVPVYINGGILVTELYIHFRPYLFEFLSDMKSKYELILYSALNSAQVNSIVQTLERDERFFEYVFCEEYCIFANLTYGVKCLDFLLSNRTLQDIILVDTTVKCLPSYTDNFIPIQPYTIKNPMDTELIHLAIAIDKIMSYPDVQEGIDECR